MTALKALILGCSQYQVQSLTVLAEQGVEIYLVDRNELSPGRSIAHHFAAIDIVDSEQVLRWMRDERLDAVVPMNDFGVGAAAAIAQVRGLPGNSPESAAATSDKEKMRLRWHSQDLPIPRFECFSDCAEAEAACQRVGFPCVMKPALSGGGGRGISVLNGSDDIEWAYRFAIPHARNGRLIVEQFVPGTEYTVEAISTAGVHSVLAISAKKKPAIRTRVATNLEYTADLPPNQWTKLVAIVSQALDALDHCYGLSHTELIIDERSGEPLLVEAGGRPGGGHIFHPIIEAVSTVNGPLSQVTALAGKSQCLTRVERRGAVYRFLHPPHGILKSVSNFEAARGVKGVLDLGVIAKPGDVVGRLRDSFDRAGFVVTHGQNRSEAVRAADEAEALIELRVEALAAASDDAFVERQ